MGYKYIRDIHIEYPFYQAMAGLLKGNKLREVINSKETYAVECPSCKKRKARMCWSKRRDTFMLLCPVDTCSLGVLVLHDLIKRYGGIGMFQEWRKASWTTTYEENWFPIQNKVPYKYRRTPHKKTFKETQELKSAALQIKIEGENPNLGATHPHPYEPV